MFNLVKIPIMSLIIFLGFMCLCLSEKVFAQDSTAKNAVITPNLQPISQDIASASSPETTKETITAPSADAISLDLRGIEITELFKVLSSKLKINILPSKNVSGRINLFLNNVKYNDVLDIIMTCQGLAYEKRGDNVIIVMTEAEYEALYGKKFNEKRKMITLKTKHAKPQTIFNALTSLKSNVGNIIADEVTGTIIVIDTPEKLKDMEEAFNILDKPCVTEVFEFQYAKVADLETDLTSLVTEGAGKVLTDERTNSAVITDLAGNMNKIRQTIKMLDQKTRQVLIEAEILQITLSDEFNYGIEWQKILNDPTIWNSVLTGSFAGTGMTSSYQRLSMGSLQQNKFNVAMNVLSAMGDVKILSSPKIAVTNNEEATIHVGTRQAIVTGTLSQSGESTITSDSVEFVDVGIKLVMVPTINRDGFVTIKIKPEVSSVTSSVTTGSASEPRSVIPIITTSEAETTVKVKDNAMIMIAGLKQHDTRSDIDGVPYLCNIPILGALFSNEDSSQTKSEIIIFLSPHIIEGDEMMAWDKQKMLEFPEEEHPKNRGYFEPAFKTSALKKQERLIFLKRKPESNQVSPII